MGIWFVFFFFVSSTWDFFTKQGDLDFKCHSYISLASVNVYRSLEKRGMQGSTLFFCLAVTLLFSLLNVFFFPCVHPKSTESTESVSFHLFHHVLDTKRNVGFIYTLWHFHKLWKAKNSYNCLLCLLDAVAVAAMKWQSWTPSTEVHLIWGTNVWTPLPLDS